MTKVLITPRSFAKYSSKPYKRLEAAGIEVIKIPVDQILTKEDMVKAIQDVDGIIVGVDPLDKEVLAAANNLTTISKYGVGTDNIDLGYCQSNHIDVTITKNANTEAVADYAIALLLAVARQVAKSDKDCRSGDWSKKMAVDVYGKKMGIIGLGAIGSGVAKRAAGFNMEIYSYDLYYDAAFIKDYHIHPATIEDIIRQCDFISLHLPLTDETKHLINKKTLNMAKENLIIINTARGGIINEVDLYEALKHKVILGAGIDVFEHEPAKHSKLLELNNVIVSSHCGASTIGAIDKMSLMAVDNMIYSLKERGKI